MPPRAKKSETSSKSKNKALKNVGAVKSRPSKMIRKELFDTILTSTVGAIYATKDTYKAFNAHADGFIRKLAGHVGQIMAFTGKGSTVKDKMIRKVLQRNFGINVDEHINSHEQAMFLREAAENIEDAAEKKAFEENYRKISESSDLFAHSKHSVKKEATEEDGKKKKKTKNEALKIAAQRDAQYESERKESDQSYSENGTAVENFDE
jgi:hypothetical protein